MYLFIKRGIDIVVSLILLVILLPFFILLSVLLLLTGEHTVFYFQERIGQNGKPFFIWKFASMLKNSHQMGTREITVRADPRVTRVGRFLRKTKINELPQIFNVLKGDMSWVGPRPLMEVSYLLYTNDQRQLIYSVRPGITGIGSLVYRDEEKIISEAFDPRAAYEKIFAHKALLEMWYKENQSFTTDFKILMVTFLVILFPSAIKLNKWLKGFPSSKAHIERVK